MKKLFLAALTSAAVIPAIGQISSTGLIAHWRFTGNVLDSSGNAHHGTPTAITYAAGRTGTPATAAVFDSASSYIAVPYAADLNVVNYSICAVLKPKAFNLGPCQASVILERARLGSASSGFYNLAFSDNAFDLGNCNAFDTSKYVFLATAGANGASPQYMPTIRTNEWTSVVVTFNGSAIRLYTNGVFRASAVASGAIGTSLDGIGIGTAPAQPAYRFMGLMDDLRLYNRVLTDSEIYIYHNPPVTSGVADIKVDENALALSPNPATSNLTIQLAGKTGADFTILDGLGRCAMSGRLSRAESTLDISSLAPGVYYLRTASGQSVNVARFVKK